MLEKAWRADGGRLLAWRLIYQRRGAESNNFTTSPYKLSLEAPLDEFRVDLS